MVNLKNTENSNRNDYLYFLLNIALYDSTLTPATHAGIIQFDSIFQMIFIRRAWKANMSLKYCFMWPEENSIKFYREHRRF